MKFQSLSFPKFLAFVLFSVFAILGIFFSVKYLIDKYSIYINQKPIVNGKYYFYPENFPEKIKTLYALTDNNKKFELYKFDSKEAQLLFCWDYFPMSNEKFDKTNNKFYFVDNNYFLLSFDVNNKHQNKIYSSNDIAYIIEDYVFNNDGDFLVLVKSDANRDYKLIQLDGNGNEIKSWQKVAADGFEKIKYWGQKEIIVGNYGEYGGELTEVIVHNCSDDTSKSFPIEQSFKIPEPYIAGDKILTPISISGDGYATGYSLKKISEDKVLATIKEEESNIILKETFDNYKKLLYYTYPTLSESPYNPNQRTYYVIDLITKKIEKIDDFDKIKQQWFPEEYFKTKDDFSPDGRAMVNILTAEDKLIAKSIHPFGGVTIQLYATN